MGSGDGKQSQYFSNSCLFFFNLPLQGLLSQTLSPTCRGLGGVLLKQRLIRDPARLWNLLGES